MFVPDLAGVKMQIKDTAIAECRGRFAVHLDHKAVCLSFGGTNLCDLRHKGIIADCEVKPDTVVGVWRVCTLIGAMARPCLYCWMFARGVPIRRTFPMESGPAAGGTSKGNFRGRGGD